MIIRKKKIPKISMKNNLAWLIKQDPRNPYTLSKFVLDFDSRNGKKDVDRNQIITCLR